MVLLRGRGPSRASLKHSFTQTVLVSFTQTVLVTGYWYMYIFVLLHAAVEVVHREILFRAPLTWGDLLLASRRMLRAHRDRRVLRLALPCLVHSFLRLHLLVSHHLHRCRKL
jgi:hypothetical protein